MGRTSFVAWLFVMALACLVIAVAGSSGGWFFGSIALFAVATLALRMAKREHVEGRSGARGGFVGWAILGMLAVMGVLFWLQTSA